MRGYLIILAMMGTGIYARFSSLNLISIMPSHLLCSANSVKGPLVRPLSNLIIASFGHWFLKHSEVHDHSTRSSSRPRYHKRCVHTPMQDIIGRLFSKGDPIIIHGKAAPGAIESWPVIG